MSKSDTSNDLPGGLALARAVQKGEWPHTMDAQAWATAWMLQLKETPEIYKDEGAMIGWFANAIMAGYDKRGSELAAKEAELVEIEQAMGMWKGLADLAAVHGNTAAVGVKLLITELEQSHAQVARCIEFISGMRDELEKHPTQTKAIKIIDLLLASIPEQSARDAEVLRAAEKESAEHCSPLSMPNPSGMRRWRRHSGCRLKLHRKMNRF